MIRTPTEARLEQALTNEKRLWVATRVAGPAALALVAFAALGAPYVRWLTPAASVIAVAVLFLGLFGLWVAAFCVRLVLLRSIPGLAAQAALLRGAESIFLDADRHARYVDAPKEGASWLAEKAPTASDALLAIVSRIVPESMAGEPPPTSLFLAPRWHANAPSP